MPYLSEQTSSSDIPNDDSRQSAAEAWGPHGLPASATTKATTPSVARSLSSGGDVQSPATTIDREGSPPIGPPKPPRGFAMRLSRHFSDSALAARAKMYQEKQPTPPVPRSPLIQENMTIPAPTPPIITTAPTCEMPPPEPRKSRGMPFKRQKSAVDAAKAKAPFDALKPSKEQGRSLFPWGKRGSDTPAGTPSPGKRFSMLDGAADDISSAGASPKLRSISSDSRSQSMSGGLGGARPTKKSTMFSLPKRDKRKSLFPLPPKVERSAHTPDTAPATPRESTSVVNQQPISKPSPPRSVEGAAVASMQPVEEPRVSMTMTNTATSRTNVSFARPEFPLDRHDSSKSVPSIHSAPSMQPPPRRLGARDRANTSSTFGRKSEDVGPPTPPTLNGSTRNSTSTNGRASLAGFLTLNRFRNSDATGSRHDSTGYGSKQNSITIARESMPLPEREDGETAAKYLERLQDNASRNVIAGMLAKSANPFFHTVLRSYTRRFAFFGEPIDMSLRKFLLEAELPKETQQVDRVIQAFADRYHECNPGIFHAPDQAYIVAFSLMMLHTDAFNRNNKYKMQKADYIKNTSGQQVSEDVLACFYDNICYTPFIHFDEDDFDGGSDRLSTFKSKKAKLRGAMPDPNKKSSGPVDPYYLIIENKLDVLRPSLKDTMVLDDPYNYLGTAKSLDLKQIQRAFHNTGKLQIISARSRPAAFESQETRDNPEESKPGVVELQVTKVGIVWRKSAKRKKARSPWSEWGAILTGSQLFFFKNVSWVKSLMQQYHTHQKHMVPPSPVVFKPPLEDFKPDALIKTDNAVALIDATYTRHKNAFTLVQSGGEEEILLADNEAELNEWLALINYAAAFRSAGVRVRGFIGPQKLDAMPAPLRRNNTNRSAQVDNKRASTNPVLARQILAARRQQMVAKIAEAEIKIGDTNKQLDNLMRNARHLLLLAPVQPRTRDIIIHSAARMDAMLKWTRRDIWRTKCYKDILYLDALEDSEDIKDEAARLRPLTMYQPAEPSNTFEDGVRIVAPVEADDSTTSGTASSRPPTRSSDANMQDNDVFRTPPESARNTEDWSWKLPPLEVNQRLAGMNGPQRQASASSVVTSTNSARRPSITHISSTSSVQDLTRLGSTATPIDRVTSITSTIPITPLPNSTRPQRDPLSHTTSTTTTSSMRRLSDTSPSIINQSTPDSAPRTRSHRRSLHRSLRDNIHDSTGSVHRHRKGKESASTVKSEGSEGATGTAADEDNAEGTPGLERREARFMIHGKHASVITFGEGWNGGIRLPSQPEVSATEGAPAVGARLSKILTGESHAGSQTTGTGTEDNSDAEHTNGDGLGVAGLNRESVYVTPSRSAASRARGRTMESITGHAALADRWARASMDEGEREDEGGMDAQTPRASVEPNGADDVDGRRASAGVFWDAREKGSVENVRASISAGSVQANEGHGGRQDLMELKRDRIGNGELRRVSAAEDAVGGAAQGEDEYVDLDRTPRVG